jgi:hypothetical protein
MSDTQQEYLQRSVRRLLIDYGLKNVCQTILNTIHEDFLCYSKLLEIKDIEVPIFLKAVVDVKPVVAEVKSDVVADIKPEVVDVKPVVVDVKPDVVDVNPEVVDVKPVVVQDISGNVSNEKPTECTIVCDLSGANVTVAGSTEKNITINTEKKPVKKKIIQRPVSEPSNEVSDENTESQSQDGSPEIMEIDDNISQSSKKGDSYKKKQRAMQKQKYEENLANGVDLKTLLTKEKLEQWHGVEGKTYAYIAAEIVGCKEEKISSLIEAFGIQRPNKNMAQDILVGKKTSKK